MTTRTIPFLLLIACAKPTPAPVPPTPEPGADACTAKQFVACRSGEDCSTLHGKQIHVHECHDRAAGACNALACAHGCNIIGGEPKQVYCAVSEVGSSHMTQCGGFSGWQCPENMRCDLGPTPGFDGTGTCVP